MFQSCSDQKQKKAKQDKEDKLALNVRTLPNDLQESGLLKMIDSYQEIYLIQINDKCGEWGGDKEQVRIYKNRPSDKILLDYKKLIINCDDPYSQKETAQLNEKDKIESNNEILELIEASIHDLIDQKLSNEQQISHSGIANYVISKDSTLIIKDYPSKEWSNFEELITLIRKK